MAACFLQFCAMCEKQIMNPCSSILYCSEACRRKDSRKPLSAAIITSIPLSPPSSEPSSPYPSALQRIPTGPRPSRPGSLVSIPSSDQHDQCSDADLAELKSTTHCRGRAIPISRAVGDTSYKNYFSNTPTQTPSLGNTPTTTAASSLSTSAGAAWRHGYIQTPDGVPYSFHDLNNRPLPTRQNRWFGSFNDGTPRGVDLVTPHVVGADATPVSHVAYSKLVADQLLRFRLGEA